MSGNEYKRKFKELKLFKMSHLVILEHDEMAKKLVYNSAHLAIMKVRRNSGELEWREVWVDGR